MSESTTSTAHDLSVISEQIHPQRKRTWLRRLGFAVVIVLWASLVSAGIWRLWGFENAPGSAAAPPAEWPSRSRIQLAQDRPTLIMLAHPRCPCSRASIGQLAAIMAQSQQTLKAYVLFIKPHNSTVEWEETDLWHTAASIPGVDVVRDIEGAEAHLFRAATSGQTFLYSPKGHLLFSGGITASRGHFGDNAGQDAIIAIVHSENPERHETPVFGCPLFNPQSECRVSIDELHKH